MEKEKGAVRSPFFTMRDPSPSQDGHMQTATLKRKRGVTLSERVPCFFLLSLFSLSLFLLLSGVILSCYAFFRSGIGLIDTT